ncbi:hypothetical protein GCM10017786_20090 [Amycolatopsis deserti]|uniref:Type I restriction modification DNA specificity domain-containing protein n=1 Tax=Amycolatopsis deserti TaxID=185696 RepID=A0ABQ3IQU3_9PSEU|nr:restriction endonuclease subunit S [Amycolatopsis deserti]GHE88114.1 hypothetical protein GCM10017786_20090 [Amycolatopsis deserti]
MSEWKDQILGDLAEIITGATPKATETDSWGDEIDFITPTDQRNNSREAFPQRRLSQIGAKRLYKRLVPAQSTNLTCIGSTIGKVSMAAREAVTNQQINSLIARQGVADPTFLYYLIKNWSSTLRIEASGSATPIINKSVLARYKFKVPGLQWQRAIGDILGTLDDKIAANEQLIAKADDLASVKWILACRSGSTVPLSSLARFVNGKAFTKDASGAGRVVIRIAELNSGIGASTVYNDIEVPEDHLARPGDLLFSWSGSLTVARWFREEAIVNQHIFKVIPTGNLPIWLVNHALRDKLQEFKAIAADKATTMGHIQRRHLDEPVTIPESEQIGRFDGLMSALWERALAAEQENLQLESTRDQLLPLLMSGKVRVRDAEKVVEGVV